MILEDITTTIVDLPTTIRSYVIALDSVFCIVINAKLSYEAQLKAYQHELNHIINGDFDKKGDVGLIEINAHGTGEHRK